MKRLILSGQKYLRAELSQQKAAKEPRAGVEDLAPLAAPGRVTDLRLREAVRFNAISSPRAKEFGRQPQRLYVFGKEVNTPTKTGIKKARRYDSSINRARRD